MLAPTTLSSPDRGVHRDYDGLRALIVDRDAITRRTTIFSLQSHSIQCVVAHDSAEALQLARSEGFDLVVVDDQTFVSKGEALVEKLVGHERQSAVIVLISPENTAVDEHSRPAGVHAVYRKPIDANSFAETARNLALAARRGRLEAEAGDGTTSLEQGEQSGQSSATSIRAADNDLTKPIVTILLQDCERASALADRLSGENVLAIPMESSDELYRQLRTERVDIIVIENTLNGFLTGLEMLERLYNDLVRPEIILLAEKSADTASRTKLLGVESLIDPASDVEQLSAEVVAMLKREQDDETGIPLAARKIVERNGNIPPVPQLLIKLLKYLDMKTEDIPLRQLTNEIAADPRSTADLLKLTNSSSLGLRHATTNVFDAVKLIGPQRAISLILSSAAIATQASLSQSLSEDFRNWYYRRCVLIANTSAVVAEKLENISGGTAFVLGLLQEVGCLVMANSFRHRYEQVFGRVREVGRSELAALEQQDFGITHADVSAALLHHWELPTSLVSLVHAHHNGAADHEHSRIERGFVHAMRIGEALADLSDIAHPSRRDKLNRLFESCDGITTLDTNRMIADAIARTTESCALFKLPTPDNETLERIVRQLAHHGIRANPPFTDTDSVVLA